MRINARHCGRSLGLSHPFHGRDCVPDFLPSLKHLTLRINGPGPTISWDAEHIEAIPRFVISEAEATGAFTSISPGPLSPVWELRKYSHQSYSICLSYWAWLERTVVRPQRSWDSVHGQGSCWTATAEPCIATTVSYFKEDGSRDTFDILFLWRTSDSILQSMNVDTNDTTLIVYHLKMRPRPSIASTSMMILWRAYLMRWILFPSESCFFFSPSILFIVFSPFVLFLSIRRHWSLSFSTINDHVHISITWSVILYYYLVLISRQSWRPSQRTSMTTSWGLPPRRQSCWTYIYCNFLGRAKDAGRLALGNLPGTSGPRNFNEELWEPIDKWLGTGLPCQMRRMSLQEGKQLNLFLCIFNILGPGVVLILYSIQVLLARVLLYNTLSHWFVYRL